MKTTAHITLIKLLGIAIIAVPLVSMAESSLKNMNVQVCNKEQTKCMKVSSMSAVGTDLKSIYVMKDMHVALINNKSGKTTTYESKSGYLDFDTDLLVLQNRLSNGMLEERSFQLSTLNESVFLTK